MKDCMELLPHRVKVINLDFERHKRRSRNAACATPPKGSKGRQRRARAANHDNTAGEMTAHEIAIGPH